MSANWFDPLLTANDELVADVVVAKSTNGAQSLAVRIAKPRLAGRRSDSPTGDRIAERSQGRTFTSLGTSRSRAVRSGRPPSGSLLRKTRPCSSTIPDGDQRQPRLRHAYPD